MELGGQERLSQAREVTRNLARALDASRTAPTPGGSTDPSADFARSLRSFVRRHGRFQLKASNKGLSLGGELLTDDQGRFAALGTQLLVGGIQELHVAPGVSEEELVHLLEALGGTEDDAATRVFEAGLEHVDVRSLSFASALQRPDEYSADVKAKLVELQKRGDELAREAEARGALGKGVIAYELTDSGGEFARLEKIPALAPRPAADDDDGPLVAVDPQAVLALRARALEGSTPEAVLLTILDATLQGFSLDPAAIGPDNVKWFLELVPDLALREGNLTLLAAIVERFTAELTVAEGPAAAAIHGVLEAIGSNQRIEKLTTVGAEGADPRAFCAILEALGDKGVPTALAAYQRTASKEVKDALNELLAENIGGYSDALRPLLAETASVDTAKFALFLASKHLAGDVADSLYEAGRTHPQAAVSEYAAFLARTHTPKGRLAALIESLEKDDVAARIAAVNALARAKDHPTLDLLVKLVQDPSFLNRTSEEMQAFLNAISEIGGKEMIDFFEEQAGRSSGLFKIRAGNEVRGTARHLRDRLVEGEKA